MPLSTLGPSRRSFLLGTAALVPGVALAEYVIGSVQPTALAAETRTASAYTPTFFTPDEWAFVIAFVDRLIPADAEGPGAVELDVPAFIDRQMEQPYGYGKLWYMRGPFRAAPETLGYQLEFTPRDIYRKGIAPADQAIREAFGKRFVDLDPAGRDQAIARLQEGTLTLSPVPAKTLFDAFLKNTQEGYFSDPIHGGNRGMAAWRMIGFPGARADFTDWVDRYGAKYPFGPVSIKDLGA